MVIPVDTCKDNLRNSCHDVISHFIETKRIAIKKSRDHTRHKGHLKNGRKKRERKREREERDEKRDIRSMLEKSTIFLNDTASSMAPE